MKHKYAIIGPVLLLLIWQIVYSLQLIDPFFLPSPFLTLKTLWDIVTSGAGLIDLAATLKRVVMAFAIAVVIGMPMGLLLGASERVYRSVEFIIDFFRSTPATALFPLFLIIFGVTDESKIAVAAFASALIIVFNTAYGVIHGKKSRILAAKIMGASRLQIFRSIILWESLPQTFIGLRNAVSLSLVVIVVTEMFIGTNQGIGHRIIDAQIKYDIADMYASILLTGIIGYIFNAVFLIAERRFLKWTSK
ncbi:ABC transporter permease [Candidatus Peregrinibacteria bacterium]|nr:ABC transporter permease [Candidatus Peregrinibacteria bacterium]